MQQVSFKIGRIRQMRRMQLGGLEKSCSLDHALFRKSWRIVDLPISVRSASWFLPRDMCFPLDIVLVVQSG